MQMNLPNKLTVGRIAMVPLVVLIYLVIPQDFCVISATNGLALRDVLAFLIFMLASLTDMFDGQIARKYHLITSFGKFFDPIADKMLVNTMLILLVYTHQANIVAVLLMIARDLIVDGLRMLASQHGKVVSAGIYGKAKTVLQMFAILFLMFDVEAVFLFPWAVIAKGMGVESILAVCVFLFVLILGLAYAWRKGALQWK